MPPVRAALLLLSIATALSACATSMAPDPPAGVDLAGSYKLDEAASDDPQKLLDKMRDEAFRILQRRASAPPPVQRPGRQGQTGGSAADSGTEEEALPPPGAPRGDPLRYSPMAHIISATVARGDFLSVRQESNEFVLDYGTSRRSFTPGAHSVVGAEGGVGDQTSGWQGHAYVIHVKDQSGPDVTEEYSRLPDGHGLMMKLHIGSGELPAVDLKRIYRPTTEAAPRQLPTND
jgi:hypothetical protein